MSRLELVRSDLGDGGWSLHVEHGGDWVLVADGPSETAGGEWARPNAADWEYARVQAARLEAGEITTYEATRASCRNIEVTP